MFNFYYDAEKFRIIDRLFVERSLQRPYGPIGLPTECWYVVYYDYNPCFPTIVSYRGYLLLFSGKDLAEKFICMRGCDFAEYRVEKITWEDIISSCKNNFYGTAVDWLVREDFTFHNFER